ncbi:TraK domain-containing protein [Noviherbaspirillum pedocola]|jgi:conjugal transfer pilus assembly protein TraK|uniref:Type-F conjugative transfer system secretin TraK n=1 Tax=Noviherbaspirillum pedocola TaxID=2801341 RepID=A0A934T233_9BURK|nr:type-F conjugative transfer system secretin TraK [Noviherbaspirillum pedocola]MBK4737837.1 type-F conjugative transfer system secretin TraK [Noviherbaspirillum pedocola]
MKRLLVALSVLSAFAAHADDLPPAPGVPPVGTPVAMHAKAPVAKRSILEQKLPGLGLMPGDKQATKANVVRVSSDRNEIIYVSAQFPNRIATPYADPKVVDDETAVVKAVGQSIYVTPKSENPITLFVSGSSPNDPVVSLTLVPKNLPSQTIVLQLDEPLAAVGAKPEEEAPSGNVYTDRIRYVMRQIALGKVPEGFAEGALPKAVARMDQLMVVPQARYSGSSYDVYRYRVENVSDATIEMDEQAFATEGVRAVAIFPNAILEKGQSTEVFVMADKAATGGK